MANEKINRYELLPNIISRAHTVNGITFTQQKLDPGGFGIVPKTIFSQDITSTELRIYLYLLSRANSKDMSCYPSIYTISKETNTSTRSVSRCIKVLEEKGLIVIERDNNHNKYFLFYPISSPNYNKNTDDEGIDKMSTGIDKMSTQYRQNVHSGIDKMSIGIDKMSTKYRQNVQQRKEIRNPIEEKQPKIPNSRKEIKKTKQSNFFNNLNHEKGIDVTTENEIDVTTEKGIDVKPIIDLNMNSQDFVTDDYHVQYFTPTTLTNFVTTEKPALSFFNFIKEIINEKRKFDTSNWRMSDIDFNNLTSILDVKNEVRAIVLLNEGINDVIRNFDEDPTMNNILYKAFTFSTRKKKQQLDYKIQKQQKNNKVIV